MKNSNLKKVAVVGVRMGSSRLPDKVMMGIMGKPVLGYLIERVRKCELIDDIVVATSTKKENDIIESYCKKINTHCFRGSENDVLGRILGALESQKAEVGVEIFGDCPLIDPEIVTNIVQFYIDNIDKYDFVSNDLKTTYPPGIEVEVYSVKALEDSSKRAVSPDIREHGTLFIRQHPEHYRLYNVEAPPELHLPDMEIELDTMEDFIMIKTIFENLYPSKPDFTIHDVINFLKKHPKLTEINRDIPRRWKQFRQE